MDTLLDLRGNIPSFIHISNGKLHDVHALDLLLPEAGAIYVRIQTKSPGYNGIKRPGIPE
jgi:fructose-1,6-bisphosphatase/inositol monophosphatase family enzyme